MARYVANRAVMLVPFPQRWSYMSLAKRQRGFARASLMLAMCFALLSGQFSNLLVSAGILVPSIPGLAAAECCCGDAASACAEATPAPHGVGPAWVVDAPCGCHWESAPVPLAANSTGAVLIQPRGGDSSGAHLAILSDYRANPDAVRSGCSADAAVAAALPSSRNILFCTYRC